MQVLLQSGVNDAYKPGNGVHKTTLSTVSCAYNVTLLSENCLKMSWVNLAANKLTSVHFVRRMKNLTGLFTAARISTAMPLLDKHLSFMVRIILGNASALQTINNLSDWSVV